MNSTIVISALSRGQFNEVYKRLEQYYGYEPDYRGSRNRGIIFITFSAVDANVSNFIESL